MAHTMRTGAEHYVYRYNVLCVPVAAVLTLQLSVGVGLLSDVPLNALSASHLRRAGRVGDPLGSPASCALAISGKKMLEPARMLRPSLCCACATVLTFCPPVRRAVLVICIL